MREAETRPRILEHAITTRSPNISKMNVVPSKPRTRKLKGKRERTTGKRR